MHRSVVNVFATAFVAIPLVAAVGADFASAANVHFKQNRNPIFTDQGLSLNAKGVLVGLGGGDILVLMVARADVVSTCTNPAGNSQPPGQNPAPITVGGSDAIPQSQIKNGNAPFNVTTNPPDPTIAGAPDCPNSRWTEAIEDLKFTSATIRVEQPPGTTVLTVACTFSQPTSDGIVPKANVSCVKQ